MENVATRPLILTLALDPDAQAHFDALRTAHFPPERNLVPAHLTLFHALPGVEEESVLATVRAASRRTALPLAATSLMRLGRGVAVRVESNELKTLHASLRDMWRDWLTAQDRQPFHPHIVIQNKAEPAQARALYAELTGEFHPMVFSGIGIHIWRYDGGPWTMLHTIPFA